VVTGASSGIGLETARGLARLGARVVLAVRHEGRGEAAMAAIRRELPQSELELVIVDLSSQASIRSCAAEILRRRPALHVLVNNAGMWSSRRQQSTEGLELTWATNVLGYFLMTELLRGALERGAPSRIVNVASALAHGLDLEDVGFVRRRYSGLAAYAQSKQANRLLTWALARRLEGTGVTANAMHPGGVDTGIFLKGGGLLGLLAAAFGKLKGRTPAEGADTVVWLASDPSLAGASGRFYMDRRERTCRLRDEAIEERLWALCESQTSG
jgi:NAD(P)-dependent dehydrogenase (short-subunit alcohol dehydrogenase family)